MSDVDDLKAKLQNKLGPNAAAPVVKASTGSDLVPIQQPVKDAEVRTVGLSSLPIVARLMELLNGLFVPGSKSTKNTAPPQLDPSLFKVLVAELTADTDGVALAQLMQFLETRSALKLQPLGQSFALESFDDPMAAAALQNTIRRTVAAEGGHLLIWGGLNAEGYSLRFSTAQPDDGSFGLNTRLEIPLAMTESATHVLYAATLAAMEAVTDAQKTWIRQALSYAAMQAEELATRPSVQMSMAQQRSVQIVFGHVALAAADCASEAEQAGWYDRAVTSYRSAQKRLNRADPSWEEGLIHRHLGSALTAQADKAKDPVPLFKEAVGEWRQAVESLTRARMPQEWAQSQIRLGNALYRLDLVTGDTELLREALQALQGALQVYSRTETPKKWADTMLDMAQVLQIYGDQLKSPQVLKKAIETCDAILQVYNRETTPLAWAKTQNTLGAALFLFDRHKGGNEYLDDAETAIEQALEIFKAHGAKGPAQVAQRNLAHVHRLKHQRKGHKIFEPDWSKEEE